MPKTPSPSEQHRRVAVLMYDGLAAFEFGIAAEIFGLARPEMGPDWYSFVGCAVRPGPLRTNIGLIIHAEVGLEGLDQAGTIVVPGWNAADREPPAELLEALRRAHARGARLVSICSGAFLLAAAGLLDHRRATTHWRYAEALAERHPLVTVDAAVLYVDDGQVLTSAGS